MTLADRFQSAVTDLFQSKGGGPSLLPLVLAQACVEVLPVNGAGLSMTDHLRVPLAASDEAAALAERLQTTIGEGPCLAASAADDSVVADAAGMAARWPAFTHKLLAETPYRSVASLPLRAADGTRMGALDLYSVDPRPLDSAALAEIDRSVAAPMASVLFRGPITHDLHAFTSPSWLTTDAARERMNVWVAIGMLMTALKLPNSDALAVLRGYAFSHECTLDEIARDVTDRQLQPEELLQ